MFVPDPAPGPPPSVLDARPEGGWGRGPGWEPRWPRGANRAGDSLRGGGRVTGPSHARVARRRLAPAPALHVHGSHAAAHQPATSRTLAPISAVTSHTTPQGTVEPGSASVVGIVPRRSGTGTETPGGSVDFRDTPEEAAFRAELRAWLKANLPDDWAKGTPQRGRGDFDRLREWGGRLHAAGYIGLTWPAEYGGRGLAPTYQ